MDKRCRLEKPPVIHNPIKLKTHQCESESATKEVLPATAMCDKKKVLPGKGVCANYARRAVTVTASCNRKLTANKADCSLW